MISLGIDLGGTQIKYGLVEDGKILDCGRKCTDILRFPEIIGKALVIFS